MGVELKEVRKTQKGEVLLMVKNGTDKMKVLQKEIEEKLPEAKTSLLQSKKAIHLKGLDEVTTEEEIRNAVYDTLTVNPEAFQVRSLRPAYGGKQNATLVLNEEQADNLIALGNIKIGWTRCKVRERIQNLKCFKCWEKGHTQDSCTNPSREHLCMKCGGEGHKAAVCKNKAFCITCSKEGHQTGGIKCPVGKPKETLSVPERDSNIQEIQSIY